MRHDPRRSVMPAVAFGDGRADRMGAGSAEPGAAGYAVRHHESGDGGRRHAGGPGPAAGPASRAVQGRPPAGLAAARRGAGLAGAGRGAADRFGGAVRGGAEAVRPAAADAFRRGRPAVCRGDDPGASAQPHGAEHRAGVPAAVLRDHAVDHTVGDRGDGRPGVFPAMSSGRVSGAGRICLWRGELLCVGRARRVHPDGAAYRIVLPRPECRRAVDPVS
jgi:hypothetical protein